ncbi:MAG TPA: hypothetical protein VMG82_16265 [Candidatus Sulfotelmatobacter sp.]|nr:hypothetical protein [Candidatus Sulfotelmatobacter sp.]
MANAQWQWAEFPAQADGYASPQWATAPPGFSGATELGFEGYNTSEGQMIPASYVLSLSGGGGGGGEPPPPDTEEMLPNTWITS